jgi:hypothetical protein
MSEEIKYNCRSLLGAAAMTLITAASYAEWEPPCIFSEVLPATFRSLRLC